MIGCRSVYRANSHVENSGQSRSFDGQQGTVAGGTFVCHI
jgi:hypothetical protein